MQLYKKILINYGKSFSPVSIGNKTINDFCCMNIEIEILILARLFCTHMHIYKTYGGQNFHHKST